MADGLQSDYLLCPICLAELSDATLLKDCQHTFCKDCITQSLKTRAVCPLCRKRVASISDIQPNRLITNIINEKKARAHPSSLSSENDSSPSSSLSSSSSAPHTGTIISTIRLSITENYAPKWKSRQGVREVMQNWYDGMVEKAHIINKDKPNSADMMSMAASLTVSVQKEAGEDGHVIISYLGTYQNDLLGKVEYSSRDATLSLSNQQVSLARRILLLGSSDKTDKDYLVGQFGEGLKLGILALTREGKKVTMDTAGERWLFKLDYNIDFGGRDRVLTVEIRSSDDVTSKLREITTTRLVGISLDEWMKLENDFLFLSKPTDTCETLIGTLLIEPQYLHQMYCKGFWIADMKDDGLHFGVNLNEVELDRDRRAVVKKNDIDRKVSDIWTKAITKRHDLLPTYYDLLMEDHAMLRYSSMYATNEAISLLASLFFANQGDNAIPILNSDKDELLLAQSHGGLNPILCPEPLYNILSQSNLIKPLSKMLRDGSSCVRRVIPHSDLTDEERGVLCGVLQIATQCIDSNIDPAYTDVVISISNNNNNNNNASAPAPKKEKKEKKKVALPDEEPLVVAKPVKKADKQPKAAKPSKPKKEKKRDDLAEDLAKWSDEAPHADQPPKHASWQKSGSSDAVVDELRRRLAASEEDHRKTREDSKERMSEYKQDLARAMKENENKEASIKKLEEQVKAFKESGTIEADSSTDGLKAKLNYKNYQPPKVDTSVEVVFPTPTPAPTPAPASTQEASGSEQPAKSKGKGKEKEQAPKAAAAASASNEEVEKLKAEVKKYEAGADLQANVNYWLTARLAEAENRSKAGRPDASSDQTKKLEAQLADALARLKKAEADAEAKQASTAANDNVQLQVLAAQAEGHRAKADAAQREVEKLQGELQAAQAELQKTQADAKQARESYNAQAKEQEGSQASLSTVRGELKQAQADLEAERQTVQTLKTKLQEQVQKVVAAIQEQENAHRQNQQAGTKMLDLTSQVETLHSQLAEAKDAARREAEEAGNKALEVVRREADQHKERASKAEARVSELESEAERSGKDSSAKLDEAVRAAQSKAEEDLKSANARAQEAEARVQALQTAHEGAAQTALNKSAEEVKAANAKAQEAEARAQAMQSALDEEKDARQEQSKKIDDLVGRVKDLESQGGGAGLKLLVRKDTAPLAQDTATADS
eukprot:TRINITY_DN124_c1_g1_i5.p1 TRINITY_DN124_c1_g1~~TRINITY_DN124_c1_g1_i5.p1  ORF type:complete len:1182 (-),score=354.74 TRINITY_DN124_c1_g1_i5:261-3785(-)